MTRSLSWLECRFGERLGECRFLSSKDADDMWRRSGVPTASLVKLAEADAFLPSLKLERQQALWDIKALRDEPLELWAAAAEREAKTVSELQEPEVGLKSMTDLATLMAANLWLGS